MDASKGSLEEQLLPTQLDANEADAAPASPSDIDRAPRGSSPALFLTSIIVAILLISAIVITIVVLSGGSSGGCANKPAVPFPLQEIKWTPCPVMTDPSVYQPASPSPPVGKRRSLEKMPSAPFTEQFLKEHVHNHPSLLKKRSSVATMMLRAQCATVAVPLDWDTESASYCSTIDIFVKRIYFAEQENATMAPKQVWWIPGGGGVPSSTLEEMVSLILPATHGLMDVYLIDKRGVGRSSFFECPDGSAATTDSAEFASKCLPYAKLIKQRLKVNTFTNTAKDMSYIMQSVALATAEATRPQVYVIGSSQGSFLTQRLLHVVPDGLIDGVVLDSIFVMDTTKVSRTDEALNTAFHTFMARCVSDPVCTEKFKNLSEAQQNSTSPGPADANALATALNIKTLSKLSPPSDCLSKAIPALFYRLARCSEADIAALRSFSTAVTPPKQAAVPGWSILTELNHDFAELWNSSRVPLLSCEQLRAMSDSFMSATYIMADVYCPHREASKGVLGYEPDAYFETYSARVPPLLIMTSDLDQGLLVGPARHAAQKYRALSSHPVHLVEFPNSGHTPSNNSPMGFDGQHCGMEVMFSYVLSSNFTADTRCITKINPIDFAGTTTESRSLAQRLFGTTSLWD